MTVKDNKKAHISDALAGDEIQALQSAKADQHRDRITRFGILKHRAKQQENFCGLWQNSKKTILKMLQVKKAQEQLNLHRN